MTRRQALGLAGAGLVSVGVGVTGLARLVTTDGERSARLPEGVELTEPNVVASEGGRLQVRLEAVAGVPLAGRTVGALGYNGSSPGPTWRIRPGDQVTVDLVNRLDGPTNLHVHGLHVTAEGNSDNVFVRVQPGETFRYRYVLPSDHRAGTFWYHPHVHGLVADQASGGLVGAIVVEGGQDGAKNGRLPVDRERLLLITDISLDEDGTVRPAGMVERMMGREGELVLVNGQLRPSLTIAPGSVERWRVVNACASRFVRLRLDGHRFSQIGLDGALFPRPRAADEVVPRPATGPTSSSPALAPAATACTPRRTTVAGSAWGR